MGTMSLLSVSPGSKDSSASTPATPPPFSAAASLRNSLRLDFCAVARSPPLSRVVLGGAAILLVSADVGCCGAGLRCVLSPLAAPFVPGDRFSLALPREEGRAEAFVVVRFCFAQAFSCWSPLAGAARDSRPDADGFWAEAEKSL